MTTNDIEKTILNPLGFKKLSSINFIIAKSKAGRSLEPMH